jgi:hypothetical protein
MCSAIILLRMHSHDLRVLCLLNLHPNIDQAINVEPARIKEVY